MAVVAERFAKPKWGDADELEDYNAISTDFPEITTESETLSDGSVRKTVVEYKTSDSGHTIKIVKKIRMYKAKVKINKRVEDRKRWRKFGECANAPRGIEPGITSIGDEVFLDLVSDVDQAEGTKTKKQEVVNLGIVCRNCGKTGDHWTLKCPYFKGGAAGAGPADDSTKKRGDAAMDQSGDPNKYVIPRNRGGPAPSGAAGGTGGSEMGKRDEAATIRVTNLSEDTKESDLSELFRSFGPISRIYLAKDKNTGLSKGFAFINFVYREDAAKAIEKLSGKFGYDHLILHLEWAKPSSK